MWQPLGQALHTPWHHFLKQLCNTRTIKTFSSLINPTILLFLSQINKTPKFPISNSFPWSLKMNLVSQLPFFCVRREEKHTYKRTSTQINLYSISQPARFSRYSKGLLPWVKYYIYLIKQVEFTIWAQVSTFYFSQDRWQLLAGFFLLPFLLPPPPHFCYGCTTLPITTELPNWARERLSLWGYCVGCRLYFLLKTTLKN